MNRTSRTAAATFLTLTLAVLGLPIVDGAGEPDVGASLASTGCCKQ
jgi:hypothetical protein